MKTSLWVAVGVLAMAMPAQAQIPPFNVFSQPYVALPGTATTVSWSTGDDEGKVVPLQFAFPWYGTNYSSVLVQTNGFVTFDLTYCTSGCNSNSVLPSTSSPNNLIAAFWDDLYVTGGGVVRYTSSATEFVVEWSNVRSYSTTSGGYTVTMQLHLFPSGSVLVQYGTFTGTLPGSASIGFEGPGGTAGSSMLAGSPDAGAASCSASVQTGCCSGVSGGGGNCTIQMIAPNTAISIGEPTGIDLAVDAVGFTGLGINGSNNVTFTANGTIKNFGRTPPATAFEWRAYVSTDRVLDVSLDGGVGDQLVAVGTVPSMGASDAGVPATLAVTAAAATTTPLDAGTYYVLIQADSQNVIPEVTETNNVGVSAQTIAVGPDLVAISVSTTSTLSKGGQVDNFVLNYANNGTVAVPVAAYQLLLSADQVADATDFVIASGTKPLAIGQTITETVAVTMPNNAPAGDFYVLLKLDPANLVGEANEANNVAFTAGILTVQRADLVSQSVQLIDPLTGLQATTARFGEAARLQMTAGNTGPIAANNFYIAAVISTDSALSLLSDKLITEIPVATMPAGTSGQPFTLDFTIPLRDAANVPFPTGQYFLFVAVDSRGSVGETNESNNTSMVGPIRITAPGPDLIVSSIQAPASAGVGETLPVFRTLRNIGNLDAPSSNYRYYLSANTIITSEDLPMQIMLADGGTADHGSVALAHGGNDSLTEFVQLPTGITPGTYFVGAIADADNTVAEMDETNNGLASSPVQVAPSSLRIATNQVPDARVGRPYQFRLAAIGEQGTSTWTLLDTLPAGLALSADGLLSGTPTATTAQVTSFTVQVANNGRTATGAVVLRVIPENSLLEIITQAMPPIVNSPTLPYQYGFAGAGGVMPYRWSLASGSLPNGVTLAADGSVAGSPRAGTVEGQTRVTIALTDATGSRVTKDFMVRVVAAGSIVIRTNSLADALVGVDYGEYIAVANLDNSALAKPLTWTTTGALPDGLSMTLQSEVVYISGRPTTAGSSTFNLRVEDAKGRSDALDFTIVVWPPRYRVTSADLPESVAPNQADVHAQFLTTPSVTAVFRVASGTLPPGLSLSEDGKLSGTVGDQGADGAWTWVVEATDANGGSGMAPFTMRVDRPPRPQSCSSTGGLSPMALLTLLGLWAQARRRGVTRSVRPKASLGLNGSRLALVSAAALVLVPAAALAQSTYVVVPPYPVSFTAITGTSVPAASMPTTVTVPFPFTYFGQTLSSVSASCNGYLAVAGSYDDEYLNQPIPHNSSFYPQAFIAPWWDDVDDGWGCSSSNGGTFSTLTTGSAPSRVLVMQWNGFPLYSYPSTRFTYQVLFYETSNRIQFAYGPVSGTTGATASIGIQGSLGVGTPGTQCGASGSCAASDFPTGQALDFVLPADLSISQTSAEQTGYAGVAYHATAIVKNTGGREATNVAVRFYLSTNTTLEAGDPVIGDGTIARLGPGAEGMAVSTAPIPASATPGNYFILSMVDPDNVIVEQLETNNGGVPMSMSIGSPTPDLVVSGLTGPGVAVPGATVQVTRSLTNAGNAPAGVFKYSYFISDNSVVTLSDRPLSVGNGPALAALAVDTQTESVVLPSDLLAGQYWLGVCVNYDSGTRQFGINEISVVNDCFTSNSPVLVSSGALTVLTATLNPATQYAPYGEQLAATGGNGAYTWAQVAGTMPEGLGLSTSGVLSGTPSKPGTYAFDVQATSGGQTQTKSLSLQVVDGTLALTVVDQDLPVAEFQKPYDASIVAVGGKPPYTWELAGLGILPAGIAFAPDGHLEGLAIELASIDFTAQVTDSAGATASRALHIRVVSPTNVTIASPTLQTAYVTREYLQPLVAVGGRAPYTWKVVRFQKLAQTPTDVPGEVRTDLSTGGALPDTLGLVIQPGAQTYLSGVPKQAGLYSLTLQVTDASTPVGITDTANTTLLVTYADGLAITTTTLPDAFINETYAAMLSHNGGRDATGISFTTPCVQQAVHPGEFACVTTDSAQALPPGLSLGGDGSIIGVPTGSPGTYSFLVRLTDALGREDVRGMSIRVKPDFGPTASGCSCATVDPSWFGGVLLAMFARRRGSPKKKTT